MTLTPDATRRLRQLAIERAWLEEAKNKRAEKARRDRMQDRVFMVAAFFIGGLAGAAAGAGVFVLSMAI